MPRPIPTPATSRDRGEAEGKADLLLRQLSRRFGPISAAVRPRLRAASPEQLDRWAERFADVASVAEVFAED